jgi:hypothetical protein
MYINIKFMSICISKNQTNSKLSMLYFFQFTDWIRVWSCFREDLGSSGYNKPRSPAIPQQGTWLLNMFMAHFLVRFWKAVPRPIFLEEQGVWTQIGSKIGFCTWSFFNKKSWASWIDSIRCSFFGVSWRKHSFHM